MGQDAAFEEGVERAFAKLRQVCAGSGFRVGEEDCDVRLHKAVRQDLQVTFDVALSDRVVDLLEEGCDVAVRIARLPGAGSGRSAWRRMAGAARSSPCR